METFRDWLKKWRADMALGQADAARALGVPLKTLQNWEIERNVPSELVREALRLRAATFGGALKVARSVKRRQK